MDRRDFISTGLLIPVCLGTAWGAPPTKLVKRRDAIQLRLVQARLESPHAGEYVLRGKTFLNLGRDNVASFDLHFPRTGYYRFEIRYGEDGRNRPPRAAALLDRRILGTTHFLTDHTFSATASRENLGEHLVTSGYHLLEIETMFEHGESIESIRITPTNRRVEKVKCRFVQLSDTHVQKDEKPVWMNRKIDWLMPEVLAEVGAHIKTLSPDFVMLTGDIVDGDTPESIAYAHEAFEPIPRPLFPVLGNHDTYRKNHANWLKIWNREFPGDQVFYSLNNNGFHFVMLDCLYNQSRMLEVPQYKWLDGDLKQHSNMPTVMALHTPVGQNGENPLLTKGLAPRIAANPQVKFVLSGHTHRGSCDLREGVAYAVSAAMVEYPLSYREFVFFENHAEVRSYQVSRKFQRETFMSVQEKVEWEMARRPNRKPSQRATKINNDLLGDNKAITTRLGREYVCI
jgi:3',5'-cyclic-AMP phosphodiesterase